MRRALRRADDGVALDAAEAEVLLQARGEDLERLAGAAGRVRDAGRLVVLLPIQRAYAGLPETVASAAP